MFNFFSKKKPTYKLSDLIWISDEARTRGCVDLVRAGKYDHVIAWFSSTQKHFHDVFEKEGIAVSVKRYTEVQLKIMSGQRILMLEHYPLLQVETELFQGWEGADIQVASSLDEPWLQSFGIEKVKDLITKLGMKPDEMLSHSLITSSLQNAQKKLEEKVTHEMKANSMEEWCRLNGI